jgi:hypothetical protein
MLVITVAEGFKIGSVIHADVVRAVVVKLSMSEYQLKQLRIKMSKRKIYAMAMHEYTQVKEKIRIDNHLSTNILFI